MEDTIARLDYKGRDIILVGTAHVSKQSAELIKKVIDEERPDSVCVELDEARYQAIQDPQSWEKTDIGQVIKTKKVGFVIANLVLGSYQKKIAKNLNTLAGQEMLQGIASAKETGAELVLADRNIRVTFLRIWRKLGFWNKIKLGFNLLYSLTETTSVSEEDVNKLLETETLESAIAEMDAHFPIIGEVLIHERDQYLAEKIRNAPGKKVVAVLGGAHVPGVKEELFKTRDISELSVVPPGSPVLKIIGWAIPIIIIGLIAYGFIVNIQTGLQQLSAWVLWNSGLAALFTALALGHPLTILTSLVAAPFTSLNPLVACGWLAGLVEAAVRKPTVKDINSIPDDIFSFKGIFRNRFLRILLIVVMANIGSSIGTFIAGADMVRSLFGG